MDVEHDQKVAEEALSRGLLSAQQLEECWRRLACGKGEGILDVAVRAHYLTLGQAAEVQQALLPPGLPHKLGRYHVVQPLGKGGMGAVYKAYDPDLDRYVAAKTVLPLFASDSEFVRRFRREARLAARLQSPHAVRIYDVGQQGETHYIVMEFVEGESIQGLVLRKGRLEEREAFAMCADVAHALEEAWEHRIIHRDIKPQNIMMDRKGIVKLADLGLAKQLRARHGDESGQFSLSTWVVGTPRYMSPEQVIGKELDFRSDAFSLGVTLYFMVTGVLPYDGETPQAVMMRIAQESVPDARAANPGLSEGATAVIRKMTARDPEERHCSLALLRRDLLCVAQGKPPMPEELETVPLRQRPTPMPAPPVRAPAWSGLMGPAVALLVLIAAVAACYVAAQARGWGASAVLTLLVAAAALLYLIARASGETLPLLIRRLWNEGHFVVTRAAPMEVRGEPGYLKLTVWISGYKVIWFPLKEHAMGLCLAEWMFSRREARERFEEILSEHKTPAPK